MKDKKTKFTSSLSIKIITLTLIISVLPLLLISIFFLIRTNNTLNTLIDRDIEQVAVNQSQTIDQWIIERMDNVSIVADTAGVQTMEVSQIKDTVLQYFNHWGIYENMSVYDLSGDVVYRTDEKQINVTDRDYFQNALKQKITISEPLISKASNQVVFVIGAPILRDEQIVGVLSATISMETFNNILESTYLGETREAYLIDQNGLMLTTSRFTDALLAAGMVKENAEMELTIDTEGSREVIQGNTGYEEYDNYLGTSVLGAYTPISSTGWGLLVEQSKSEAIKEITLYRLITLISVAVLFILIVFLTVLLSRSITRPLGVITRAAKKLAVGDTLKDMDGKEIDTVRQRKDEIGEIGKAFDQIARYMAEFAQTIRENDLSHKFTPKSEKDELGIAFSNMIENLREIIGNVAQSAESLGGAAERLSRNANQTGYATRQIVDTMQQIAKGTQQQASAATATSSSVAQVTQAIDSVARGAQEQSKSVLKTSEITNQINNAIQQVAENAAGVAERSAVAANAARKGSETVHNALEEMQNIKIKVGASSDKVQEMGKRSEQIGAIVETIDDIATQTNLLAVNAAIEAARAGESGKGFSVVADEVRKLAERSSIATKEINGLINGIIKTVSEAVNAMQEGTNEVELGIKSVNLAGTALSDILGAIETVNNQATLVADASDRMKAASEGLVIAVDSVSAVVEENTTSTEQMSIKSSEVTQAIEQIASVSEENSAAVEQVSASSEEMSEQIDEVTSAADSLTEMAHRLKTIVAQFKLRTE